MASRKKKKEKHTSLISLKDHHYHQSLSFRRDRAGRRGEGAGGLLV
jgi:hypothetical protein